MIASPRARPGFTLIELLVVLAIVAMLVALARPMYAVAVPGAQLKGDVLELSRTLRHSRNQAVGTGKRIDIVFEPEQSRYTAGSSDTVTLSRRIKLRATSLGGDYPPGGEDYRLAFQPDGSSSGASIELRSGNKVFGVDVDWLTGRVRVAEIPGD